MTRQVFLMNYIIKKEYPENKNKKSNERPSVSRYLVALKNPSNPKKHRRGVPSGLRL